MNMLMRYDFTGNIRELENIIEYCFVVCHGSIIQKEHLPDEFLIRNERLPVGPAEKTSPVAKALDEEARIRQALENHCGRRAMAAQELGIDRTTLWRKMKRYGIDIKEFKE
jgi:DNA-binding NtrC family response regulator